jgi:hypothetical protein
MYFIPGIFLAKSNAFSFAPAIASDISSNGFAKKPFIFSAILAIVSLKEFNIAVNLSENPVFTLSQSPVILSHRPWKKPVTLSQIALKILVSTDHKVEKIPTILSHSQVILFNIQLNKSTIPCHIAPITPLSTFQTPVKNSTKNPGIAFTNAFISSQYLITRYITPAITATIAATTEITSINYQNKKRA